MARNNKARQRTQSQQDQKNRQAREARFSKKSSSKKRNKTIVVSSCALVVVLIVVWAVSAAAQPSPYDPFAKCLTEAGAVMQGEDWCPFTRAQKNMFGKSFDHVVYEVNPDLDMRPTWIIGERRLETVQSFEALARATGCEEHLDLS